MTTGSTPIVSERDKRISSPTKPAQVHNLEPNSREGVGLPTFIYSPNLKPLIGLEVMYYSFQKDIVVGREYEDYLIEYFTRRGLSAYPNPFTDYERLKAFDIVVAGHLVEVKWDEMSFRTKNVCLETDLTLSAAELFIVNDHVFTKLDIWTLMMKYWDARKWVGDGKRTEVICPSLHVALRYGMSLEELVNQLTKTI